MGAGTPFTMKMGMYKFKANGKTYKQAGVMKEIDALLKKEGAEWVKAFVSNDGIGVMYSLDKTQHGSLKHLSVSKADRYPDWDDILALKEHFFGDVDAMMVMPKKEDYVNVQKFCFHLYQTPSHWNIR